MLKRNLITLFRKFYFALELDEQKDLWDIMTALRGEDEGDNQLKVFTTCRVRGELLGIKGTGWCERVKCFVASNLRGVKASPHADDYSPRGIKLKLFEAKYHWSKHLTQAIHALNRYRPKASVRDLQKFLERD